MYCYISYWWDAVCWLIYRGDDTKFYHLVQLCLTLGCMEIGHFWGSFMTGWELSHSLMLYSPGNWPMPWNLSGNFLMRSSVDLMCTVFLGAGGAGVGPGRWEVSWMTLTAQLILTTSKLSHDGSPGWQGQGCLLHTNRSLYGRVVHWGNQAARW